jgi:hypothetical protein
LAAGSPIIVFVKIGPNIYNFALLVHAELDVMVALPYKWF